jgi:RNA 3'-terminal phosphate cyclase-like protein
VNSDNPGVRDFEANFLRLIEKLTNGCVIEIDEIGFVFVRFSLLFLAFFSLPIRVHTSLFFSLSTTGTTVLFKPGFVVGGSLTHDCGTAKSIGWFLEGIIPLAPFSKKPFDITFNGITNDDNDISVTISLHNLLLKQKKRKKKKGKGKEIILVLVEGGFDSNSDDSIVEKVRIGRRNRIEG